MVICKNENCNTRALYGIEWKKPLYCRTHNVKEMNNVINERCKNDSCKKIPNYNYENLKALYCKEHKLDGMIDVKNKRCKNENCYIIASFGNELNKALYCNEHKLEGMEDVKSKRCKFENCKRRPTYNYENLKALYCKEHKLEKMIDVNSKRCKFDSCKKGPNYNYENLKPLYCKEHKLDGMIDVKHIKCKFDSCDTRANPKYNEYCAFCFINLFPNDKLTRNFKTKENYITQQITEKFNNLDWILDRTISSGCSRRRPDMLLHLGHRAIVIEIDENQHSSYENICENKRYMEISQDLDHIPITFIRFNPDSYKINEKTIRSCFSVNRKTGICGLSNKKEMQKRLNILYETLIYNLENENEKTINIVNLFYNQKI